MAELARATGIRKETIHFYLREGLLPKPEKTSANMAWYDASHVERLQLIRRLQTEKYLPLEVIKRVLKGGRPRGGGEDIELLAELFHLTGAGSDLPLTRAELRRRSGLDGEAIELAERAGLIAPAGDDEGAFAPEDLRTLQLLAEVERGGVALELAVESFALCARHLGALARDEARQFFERLLRAGEPTQLLDGMRRAREPQARFIAHARARLLEREIADYVAQIERAVEETGGPAAFPLSDARLAASGFHGARAELAARADADPLAAELLCLAEFTALRVDDLAVSSARAIARHGERPRLLSWRGAVAVERGDLDGGLALLERAVADRHAAPRIASALLGAARVRLGRRTIEEAGAGSALRQVAAGLEELDRLDGWVAGPDPLCEGERLRGLLARGRVRTSLPPFFATRAGGIEDLRAVLDGAGAAWLVPGLGAALELNAAWFLAGALEPGAPEAQRLRERAAAIDPAGPVAARAARAPR